MSDKLLMADLPDGALLFACVAPEARFAQPAVAHGKLGASLHPFATEIEARAALKAAGGVDVREWKRKSSPPKITGPANVAPASKRRVK